MKRIGFDTVQAMEEGFISSADRPYAWGWGLQDEIFSLKCSIFWKSKKACPNRLRRPDHFFVCSPPLPAICAGIKFPGMNNIFFPIRFPSLNDSPMPFTWLTGACGSFPAIAAPSDFANSLVIMCGDHGFPAGEHGNFFSEIGCFEESFRTPLLIWWPGHVAPRVDAERVCSQLDLAPTVLELLGISATTHFMGRSLLRAPLIANPVTPLFQPYDGMYLCLLQYPKKYAWHLRTGREYLYDLVRTPWKPATFWMISSIAGSFRHCARQQFLFH